MDRNELKQKFFTFLGKYRYVILVVILGLAMMSIGDKKETVGAEPESVAQKEEDPETKLEEILCRIQGVGRVEVMLTEAAGRLTDYQTDCDTASDGSVRCDTVILSGQNREESGLIRTVTPPTYLGAIVVCQGGDNATVRYALIQAVSNVTGLSSDRITVLKMK